MKANITTKLKPRDLVALSICLLLLVEMVYAMHWQGADLAATRVLRVAAPEHEWMHGTAPLGGPGFEQEMLDAYCRENGLRWQRLTPASWEEAWAMVRDGRADVVIGMGATPPKGLQLAQGPAYASFNPVIIHNVRRYGVRRDCEMCEKPILVNANAKLHGALESKGDELDCAPTAVVSDGLNIVPLLRTLDDNQARFALVDEGRFRMWQPFYHRIKTSRTLPGRIAYRWYWRTDDEGLDRSLEAFWARKDNSPALADLYDKYYGFLPEEADHFQIYHLLKTVREELPRYAATIAQAARKNDVDPLLLVAVIYQESRFDPHARSKTGVRGLMQITQDTARLLGVNRNDPRQSIHGGARYLRKLYDRFELEELDEYNRWLFALAAYNRGPGHVYDAAALSRRLGASGKTWRELKNTFPKLAWKRWFKDAKHGYTRGFEVVDYVERIRYYHYILRGLIELERPEGETLTAVLDTENGAKARFTLARMTRPAPERREVALLDE